MAKMTIEGQEAMITGMNISGGGLPTGFSVKLDVILDFEGVSMAKMAEYACGGSSARVKLQATLRKLSTAKLNELAKKPLTVHITQVDDSDLFMTPEDKMAALLANMTPAQKSILAEQLANG